MRNNQLKGLTVPNVAVLRVSVSCFPSATICIVSPHAVLKSPARTLLIYAWIELRNFGRAFPTPSGSDVGGESLERGLHRPDPPLVVNFPVKKYGDVYFSSAETTLCAICLAEYHEEEMLRILPHCGHYFHMNCIDNWLQQHWTCPVCRISLPETNEKNKRALQPMHSFRSHHRLQSTDVQNSCHLLNGRRFLSPSREDARMVPRQESQPSVSGDNAEATGESISSPEGC